jgi:CheY-like chemotaxis protein
VSADQWISLLRAIADLLGVLIWPALILILVVRFSDSIGNFLSNMREVSARAGGVEVTAKRQEAVAALGAAIASSPAAQGAQMDPSQAAAVVAQAVPDTRTYRRIHGARVLWVDDRPDNNRYERQSLEALGVDFSLSTSTEDALAQLSHRRFDLVLSDMGRPPDPHAGYTLLDDMRRRGDQTPFVIYASSRAAEHVAEARRHGAVGCTNSPTELIELVTQVLTSER